MAIGLISSLCCCPCLTTPEDVSDDDEEDPASHLYSIHGYQVPEKEPDLPDLPPEVQERIAIAFGRGIKKKDDLS